MIVFGFSFLVFGKCPFDTVAWKFEGPTP